MYNDPPLSKRHSYSLNHLNNHPSLTPFTPQCHPSYSEIGAEINYPTTCVEGCSAHNTSSLAYGSAHKSIFPKSKSSSHLSTSNLSMTKTSSCRNTLKVESGLNLSSYTLSNPEKIESDWLQRTGALMLSSARGSKGQNWLVSRASSTSMVDLKNDISKDWEHGFQSRKLSGRESSTGDHDDEFSSPDTLNSMTISPINSRNRSRSSSRLPSRVISRCGSKAGLLNSPATPESEDYFKYKDYTRESQYSQEPGEVDYDVAYTDDEIEHHDEEAVRDLARNYSQGFGGYIEKMLGWKIFALDEDLEEARSDSEDEDSGGIKPFRSSFWDMNNVTSIMEVNVPPPEDGDISGWQDISWLFKVAVKILL